MSLAPVEEIDEEKERNHFQTVVNAFQLYKLYSLDRILKTEKNIFKLPSTHRRRLEKYSIYLTKFKKALDTNDKVVHLIIRDVDNMFENLDESTDSTSNRTENFTCRYNNLEVAQKLHAMLDDVEKVQSVLKSIVRDWSDMGAAERNQCYKPILDELDSLYIRDRSSVNVLVPGAGLGRLMWEISRRGFTCQGNEFSLFMLFASHFVLNRCPEPYMHTVHPWLHQYVNNISCEHQLVSVRFPDVNLTKPRYHDQLSITAGDFLKVYREPDAWTCVATCFFIDCAQNVIEFVERIFAILEPGGYWINLGPLLYHYCQSEMSIEPPYDILLDIIRDVGFDIVKEQTGVKTKYTQNPNSMMQNEYDSVFFVCRKPSVEPQSFDEGKVDKEWPVDDGLANC